MNIQKINFNTPVHFKSNVATSPMQTKQEAKCDTVELNNNKLSEHVAMEKTNFSITNPEYSYEGVINKKEVTLKASQKGMINPTKTITGTLNDKQINYTQTSGSGFNNKNIEGQYGESSFELNFQPATLLGIGKSTITGKINDKEVNLEFPGSEVPKDEETKDIITTLLMIEGYKPVSAKGEFKRLTQSDWKQKADNDAMMVMMATQPQTPAYTPTWHYDTVGLPGGAPTFY